MNGQKNRYVSILKQKAGELGAVRELANGVWDGWNPLFELLADDGLDPAVTRQDVIGELSRSCRHGAVVFLDFDAISFLTANHIGEILTGLEQQGLVPVPVVTLSSNQNVRDAVSEFIADREHRAGVRLFFNEPGENTAANIDALIAAVGINIANSHLFVDLEFIDSDYLPTVNAAFPAIVGLLPHLMQWGTTTVVGTGFPRILEIPGGGNAQVPRTEWEFFNAIRVQFAQQVQRLDFGDYAVTNPQLIENL